MIEKIRTLTLLIAISVLGYGGYVFLSTFQTTSESIDIQFDDDGLDVKIKNFKTIDLSGLVYNTHRKLNQFCAEHIIFFFFFW